MKQKYNSEKEEDYWAPDIAEIFQNTLAAELQSMGFSVKRLYVPEEGYKSEYLGYQQTGKDFFKEITLESESIMADSNASPIYFLLEIKEDGDTVLITQLESEPQYRFQIYEKRKISKSTNVIVASSNELFNACFEGVTGVDYTIGMEELRLIKKMKSSKGVYKEKGELKEPIKKEKISIKKRFQSWIKGDKES